jgi:prepilin-type N-terminal cleavage/methylation domain-containing protein
MRNYHRSRQRGLTLVELLVAIVIATVAFAALVPLYVNAMQKTSADNMRLIATNLAQDKIELIRGLSFNQTTADNLQKDLLIPGVEFGKPAATNQLDPVTNTSVPANLDTSSGRQLVIHYDVADSSGTTDLTAYKTVTVTVWWTGNPTPLKPVVLQTIVYNQYSGPQLVSPLGIDPPPDSTGPTTGWYTSNTISRLTFSATVNATQVSNTWGVKFVISDPTGQVSTQTYSVMTPPPPPPSATYTAPPWQLGTVGSDGAVPDGQYIVTATAYSLNSSGNAGVPGNTLTSTVQLERSPPTAVTPQALAGPSSVTLHWTLLPSQTVVGYRIYGAATLAGVDLATPQTVDNLVNCYQDINLNPNSTYYYKVIAVDVNGRALAPAEVDAVSATTPASSTIPAAVMLTSAVQANNGVVLQWTDVNPTTAIGYLVLRSDNGTPPVTQPVAWVDVAGGQYKWVDSNLTWGKTYSYTVEPINSTGGQGDQANLSSGVSVSTAPNGWANVTLTATPLYTLNVQVIASKLSTYTVKAQLVNSYGQGTTTYPLNNGTLTTDASGWATFGTNVLPYGSYRVTLYKGTASQGTLGVKLMGDPSKTIIVNFNL